MDNIIIKLFSILKIKYTKEYFETTYYNTPDRDNFYGISKILSLYNIENLSLSVEDKFESFMEFNPPFICLLKNEFVIVTYISEKIIKYTKGTKILELNRDEFISLCSNEVLLVERNSSSIEPNYKSNFNNDLILRLKKYSIAILLGVLFIVKWYSNDVFISLNVIFLLICNFIGLYISYGLILKHVNIKNETIEKFCTYFSSNDNCNNSKINSSNFFGLLNWDEIGFSYFITNIFIISFLPLYFIYTVYINILILPYTIWSIGYQKLVLKQWCPLCILVQFVIWGIFIIHFFSGMIQYHRFELTSFVIVGILYLLPVLIINLLIIYWKKNELNIQTYHQYIKIVGDEKIFKYILKANSFYNINPTFGILWGNLTHNNIITVVISPYCSACREIHNQIMDLLTASNYAYKIQYILSSFNPKYDEINKLIISMYCTKSFNDFNSFIDEWYNYGVENHEKFIEKYSYLQIDENILAEFHKHQEWISNNKIFYTPFVLLNGYMLPEKYKIKDLLYFIDAEL